MKLVTFTHRGETREELGLLRAEGVLPLEDQGFAFADMNDLICRGGVSEIPEDAQAVGPDSKILSPIPRPKQEGGGSTAGPRWRWSHACSGRGSTARTGCHCTTRTCSN